MIREIEAKVLLPNKEALKPLQNIIEDSWQIGGKYLGHFSTFDEYWRSPVRATSLRLRRTSDSFNEEVTITQKNKTHVDHMEVNEEAECTINNQAFITIFLPLMRSSGFVSAETKNKNYRKYSVFFEGFSITIELGEVSNHSKTPLYYLEAEILTEEKDVPRAIDSIKNMFHKLGGFTPEQFETRHWREILRERS